MDEFWTSGFWRDLNEGDINFRDNLQFELKSKFPVNPKIKKNIFKQDFFMFIPDTLQIDRQSFLKDFFYMDQTNLIRYQTPVFSLPELSKSNNKHSPLNCIRDLLNDPDNNQNKIIDELKLLGAIFRSAVRRRVRFLVLEIQNHKEENFIDNLITNTNTLLSELKDFRAHFLELKQLMEDKLHDEQFLHNLSHVDEYLVSTIEYYLTGYLDRLKSQHIEGVEEIQQHLYQLLIEIDHYRHNHHLMPKKTKDPVLFNENILHRHSLLSKFIIEALKLYTNRIALQERYGQALGIIAAGVAMFVYMALFGLALFAWESPPFVFTSFPIILLAVLLYVLKDRLKEGLKVIYKHRAFKWFPDYTTKIKSPGGVTLGVLKEFFSFIKKKDLPKGFLNIRNKDFHEELPYLKRHESIIHYKREVHLAHHPYKIDSRRKDLNTIFRFNVHRFIEKANDSLQAYLSLEPLTFKLIHERLPKVYHLNIIIRTTYQAQPNKLNTEINKFRVVVDKSGIKRVEKL